MSSGGFFSLSPSLSLYSVSDIYLGETGSSLEYREILRQISARNERRSRFFSRSSAGNQVPMLVMPALRLRALSAAVYYRRFVETESDSSGGPCWNRGERRFLSPGCFAQMAFYRANVPLMRPRRRTDVKIPSQSSATPSEIFDIDLAINDSITPFFRRLCLALSLAFTPRILVHPRCSGIFLPASRISCSNLRRQFFRPRLVIPAAILELSETSSRFIKV